MENNVSILLKIVITVLQINLSRSRTGVIKESIQHYTNTWLVQISGTADQAYELIKKEQFEILEKVHHVPGLYYLRHPKHPKRGKYENSELTLRLRDYKNVLFAQQVTTRKAERKFFKCPKRMKAPDKLKTRKPVNDIFYNAMWYLHDCRASEEDGPDISINVVKVWKQMKLYGSNIKVLVVDDGIDTEHIELRDNYDSRFGIDLVDTDTSPNPGSKEFTHGTSCAGVIAGKANNLFCGAGIAPLATLGGVRLLGDDDPDDYMEGTALAFKLDEIDISNNSWGPPDDGKNMMQPKHYQRTSIKEAIDKGRNGKGVIYVVSAGNGKFDYDDMCGYDWMTNLQYTITVASVDENGGTPIYSERCSAVMVVTYSGNGIDDNYNIVAPMYGNKCTDNFTGTSASAPIVSGVIALVLEANPELNWREVQHIIVYTSKVYPMKQSFDWVQNNAGFWVSHDFGFGLINPYGMVEMAKEFVKIPPMVSCVTHITLETAKDRTFSRFRTISIEVRVNACEGLPAEINFLEHVQLLMNIQYPTRGSIKVDLISPHGTVAHLLEPRNKDNSRYGLTDWVVDSIQTWGEFPRGRWRIVVSSEIGSFDTVGQVGNFFLIFHGTRRQPIHYDNPRHYDVDLRKLT